MLLGAGDHHLPQTGATDTAKWQSFSIRSVLGDALHDDDDEEDLDVVVDAGRRPDGIDQATTRSGEAFSPTDLSPGASSSSNSGACSDDVTSRDEHQDDGVQKTSDSSSLLCTDGLRDFSRWTAFRAAPNVIVTSTQHPAALNNRYSSHGIPLGLNRNKQIAYT